MSVHGRRQLAGPLRRRLLQYRYCRHVLRLPVWAALRAAWGMR